MANQKEIRTKITSVKKTKKITLAMKLVAAAKVNKMQKRVNATRPFTEKVTEVFSNLQKAVPVELLEKYPLLKTRDEVKTVLLVVVSSDRGLCGAYNANIVKATAKRIKELRKEGKKVKLTIVGSKARAFFHKTSTDITQTFCHLPSTPTVTEADLIAEHASELYANGTVDRVELISTKFISMVNNEVRIKQFLPVKIETNEEETKVLQAEPDVIFDPDSEALIAGLLPMYINNVIYQSLLDATTSELASRMTAMSNATNNAEEVIKKLNLSYNKARQAAITQEISEIVGGAAAL